MINTKTTEYSLNDQWPGAIINGSGIGHPPSCGCAACSQANQNNVNLGESVNSGSDTYGQDLTTDLIIAHGSSIPEDKLLGSYLHSDQGIIYLAFNSSVDETRRNWWKDVIADTDSIIEPEFAIVDQSHPSSQLNIYDDVDLGDSAGMFTGSSYQYQIVDDNIILESIVRESESKIEISPNAYSWSSSFANADEAGWKHVAYHELGHALGLEHPFNMDDGDGVASGETNINDTIMSYTSTKDSDGSPRFTTLDQSALIEIYGEETGQIANAPDGVELLLNQGPFNTHATWKSPSISISLAHESEGSDSFGSLEEPGSGRVSFAQLEFRRHDGYIDNEQTLSIGTDFDPGLKRYYTGLDHENLSNFVWEQYVDTPNYFDLFWPATPDGNYFENAIEFEPGQESAYLDIQIAADNRVEDYESFRVWDFNNKDSTLAEFHIYDYGSLPSYYITTSADSINEGQSLTTTINTTNVEEGTELYWRVDSSNITEDDLSEGQLSGSFIVNTDETFSFEQSFANDQKIEGPESLRLEVYSDPDFKQLEANGPLVEIIDTSTTPDPTYSLSTSAEEVDEGEELTTSVSTANVEEGTKLYWQLSGNNITANDLEVGELEGSAQVDSQGKASFSHTFAEDLTTEGLESLIVKLFSDQANSQLLAESSTVQINDNSTTPSTYSLNTSTNVLNEGDTLNTTVSTTDVDLGTELFWELEGEKITADDLSSGELSGSNQVDADGNFSLSHTFSEDLTTEGIESLIVKLFSDQTGNELLAQSSAVEINDTSKTPPPSTPDLIATSDSGNSDSDNLTNDNTPTFSGTAKAGSSVELFADGISLGSSITDSNSNWSYTVANDAPLADGSIAITATSTETTSDLQRTAIPVASPVRSAHESSNSSAFAALKDDGSVVTWGHSVFGGDSSSVATELSSGVNQIFSTSTAFAALKDDGSVVTWGSSGGDSSSVDLELSSGVNQIFSTLGAFAALKDDGSVVSWGNSTRGGDSSSVDLELSSGVNQIFSSKEAFAAVKDDGSVVSWGHSDYGGDSSSVDLELSSGVNKISSAEYAFAALKDDGSVVTWGNSPYGGDSSSVSTELSSGVNQIFSTDYAFAALKDEGSVVTWGASDSGGDSSSVADQLSSGVNQIFSTDRAFAALKDDGSVVSWGSSFYGGRSSFPSVSWVVDLELSSGVNQIFSNRGALAALKDDGSVVTWGNPHLGGDSSSVDLELSSGVNQIFSTYRAFAAVKDDGSVVTWGSSGSGGDSSSVAAELSSGVNQIFSHGSAFAALKDDGSVVSWGHSDFGGDSSSVADQLSSGVVSFADPFHDDRLTVTTSTTDPSDPLNLTIDATAPAFSSGETATAIKENSGEAQVIYTAAADDSSDVSYSLKQNNNDDAASFSIDASTGKVSLKDDPDYETNPSYSFSVSATDLAGNSSDQLVDLNINNIYETYILNTSTNVLNEGESLTTNISTTDVAIGTELFWALNGDNITQDDLRTGQISGSHQVGADGNFSLSHTFSEDLTTEGIESLIVKLFSDQTGSELLAQSSTVEINDTSKTPPPSTPDLIATSDSGISDSDNLTNDNTPSFSGTAEAGSSVQLFADGVSLGSSITDNNSNWSYTVANDSPLADGSIAITATTTKETETSSSDPSDSLNLTIDATAPAFSSSSTATPIEENSGAAQVIYTAAADDASDVSYSLKQGNSDDAASFSIDPSTGKVSLTDDPDYETNPSYSFSVSATDLAGNSSEQDVNLGILDDTPPSTPDLISTSDSGISNSDDITSDNTPSFSGTAKAGSSVEVFADGISLGSSTTDSNSNWSYTVANDSPLADGSIAITATTTKTTSDLQRTAIPVASPGRTTHEFPNQGAFAAVKDDGSVITWGNPGWGGDSSSVAADLSSGVNQIFSNSFAFAAVKDDGSVVSWGDSSRGGDSSSVDVELSSGVNQIFSTREAFAALKDDGSVVTWGLSGYGGDSSSVADELSSRAAERRPGSSGASQIFSTESAFAALTDDGSVVSWGDSSRGGDGFSLTRELSSGVNEIFSNNYAFAALKDDGSVVTWGDSRSGGDSSSVSVAEDLSSGVNQIFSTSGAFAALKDDGSVVTWGDSHSGGDSSMWRSLGGLPYSVSVAEDLSSGVNQIFSNDSAFAAVKDDGSVVTWGESYWGGDSSSVDLELSSGVNQIFSAYSAFAALKDDGSVVTWGGSNSGGDSSNVAADLSSGVNQIFSIDRAFAALKDDGSVVTWGSSSSGGDSSSVAAELSSGVNQIFSNKSAFAALKDDGSVVTWGNSDRGGDSSSVANELSSGVVSFADPFHDDRLIFTSTTTDPSDPLNLTIDATAPAFSSGDTTNPIEENSGAAQVIYNAAADDASDISYSLKQNNNDDAASFSIDPSTGKVSLTDDPDYETNPSYSFSVSATDLAGNSSEQDLNLEIKDIDGSYILSTSRDSLNEGEQLTSTVSTHEVSLGSEIHWSLSGTGINQGDFAEGALTGSGQTDADGKFSFSHTLRNDQTKEGPENLEIKLFSDDLRSDQVGNTASVEIKDTSRSREYVSRGDSAYVIVDGPTWEEAEANATKLGGHLATPNNQLENQFLIDTYKNKLSVPDPNWGNAPRSGAWIGLSSDKKGELNWSSGEQLDSTYDAPYGAGQSQAHQEYLKVGTRGGFYLLMSDPSGHAERHGGLNGWWQEPVNHIEFYGLQDTDFYGNTSGIAEISLARNNPDIANQWTPNPPATADSDLELSYSLHSTNGTDTQTDLKQLAVLGDSVDWQDTYRLDITAKSLAAGYNLETADITINFDPFLFNEIKTSDITIGGDLPIANAVRIDNDVGTIRIAAASLGDLDPGDLYGNHLADAGSSIGTDGAVLASIDLNFNEFRLDTLTQNSNGKILDPSTPLFFGLSANQDETVFSKALNDGSGFVNREIKSLRDLGGDLAVDGTKVTLYEATINLEEQGDGLILSSDLEIGSYNSKQTNLVRAGDTITATSEWTNVGNIQAKDIQITGLTNANASLTSSGFYISSPDDSQTSTNLESGSFVDGAFVQAGQETAQLVADIEITGAAGNVVDLSQGILSLQATGSDVFENQKGSKNLITFQGDLNYDGRVSMKDLAYLNAGAARQQEVSEHPDAVDANSDGFVDASVARGVDANFDGQISMADLAVLDADWGQSLHQAYTANNASGTESSFIGSDQITWQELDRQGTTGDATWDNQAFHIQNGIEAAANDFVESLESPAAVGVIGGDGNETANDGGIAGDYFQDPLTG
ncbi:Ig-like domain-containing protein [Prochlorococcus sp. MIT 1201]|uniref:Ig-like domain-containing protein n=1 Tax=Prochlorococcus sp. MIT 1201 TaxID=3082535 RepID=UPI0039A58F4C